MLLITLTNQNSVPGHLIKTSNQVKRHHQNLLLNRRTLSVNNIIQNSQVILDKIK